MNKTEAFTYGGANALKLFFMWIEDFASYMWSKTFKNCLFPIVSQLQMKTLSLMNRTQAFAYGVANALLLVMK